RQSQQIARGELTRYKAADAGLVQRRREGAAELFVELNVDGWCLPELQGQTELDAAPRDPTRHHRSEVALERREHLRETELHVEITVVERPHRQRQRRFSLLARDGGKARHRLHHRRSLTSSLVPNRQRGDRVCSRGPWHRGCLCFL